ncbi:hypothetical protein DR85_756 [Francisella tularensis]|nr:hypothetical protein DR85_756 [Francisella tularensis]
MLPFLKGGIILKSKYVIASGLTTQSIVKIEIYIFIVV